MLRTIPRLDILKNYRLSSIIILVILLSPFNIAIELHLNSNNDISIADKMIRCTVQIINFRGLDLNFPLLLQPIVLLRYISFPDDEYLYPFEMSPVNSDNFADWSFNLNINKLKRRREIKLNNKTHLFEEQIGIKYASLTSTDYFRSTNKNKQCEATIYLHPPKEKDQPFLYYDHSMYDTVLKIPFWIKNELNNSDNSNELIVWQKYFLNTVPKYTVLICDTKPDSICLRKSEKKKWISAVLGDSENVNMFETILIHKTTSPFKWELYTLCPYCNLCNPFKLLLVESNEFPNINDLTTQDSVIEDIQKANQFRIDIILSLSIENYYDFEGKPRTTKRAVLEHINLLSLEDGNKISYLADLHLLSDFLPKNSTLRHLKNIEADVFRWKTLKISTCRKSKYVAYHPKLRPLIQKDTHLHLGSHQDFGLVWRRRQLRFVSCHEEKIHWLHQLKELVTVFDISTWVLLILLVLATSKMMKYVCKCAQNATGKQYPIFTYGDTWFLLYSSILDQSSIVFGRVELRKKLCFYLTFSCIPFVFFTLGNHYKGDNITRLTLSAPLVPFDTFDSLIDNQFKIFVRRVRISKFVYRYLRIVFSIKNDYIQENGHEAYPLVSELWNEILTRWSVLEARRLKHLKDELSNNMWKYLNHSEMFPPKLNQSFDKYTSYYESVDEVLELGMEECNKSAIILKENMAISVYTHLLAKKKPVYFGKEVISENLGGYRFSGYFPTYVFRRSKHYFQSGIAEWWTKYFKWVVMVKTRAAEIKLMLSKGENDTTSHQVASGGNAYALVCIPLSGLIISLLAFIFFDNLFFNKCVDFFKKVFSSTAKDIMVKILSPDDIQRDGLEFCVYE